MAKEVNHVFIWSSGLHFEKKFPKKIEDLKHLQGIVGGYIELAQGRWDGKNYDMWIDEEGLLKRKEKNNKATQAYHSYWHWYNNNNPSDVRDVKDINRRNICGNVVLTEVTS